MTKEKPYFYVPYYTRNDPQPLTFMEVSRLVGPGWTELLKDLMEKLEYLGWNGGLLQVKEKFGGLRFYWKNNISHPLQRAIADDLVSLAENKSHFICEDCGDPGETRRDLPWIRTLCQPCFEKDPDENQ